ncbi:MAG TPA: glycine cleavage system aminomethyltransferase GcvT [Polyangiaceae bacterium]|jgi:aminomethyltransferase|nr:glycine cleavage system aminomethyltransferase GcvT [Polyangiaceae bacterium]
MTETLAVTPLFAEHEALGARFVPYAGWRMPVQYRGVTEEHHAVRRAVGLFDVSHMGRLLFRGPRALEVIGAAISNDLSRLVPGQALYTCCCNEQGGILDDLIVYRLPASGQGERVLVVCNAANHSKIAPHLSQLARGRAEFEDLSPSTSLIAVQGPRALELLAALGVEGDSPASLPAFHVRETRAMGIACSIARTGYTGEDGVEVVVQNADAPAFWRGLIERGKSLGVEAIGLAARDTLRLEARLSLYGNEIDETTNPFEAGLGWTVKLEGRDFIGKAALAELARAPRSRQIVGFEMVGRGIARHGYPIIGAGGEPLGVVTSGAPSPTLGKSIGLGYVPLAHAALGSELLIDCRGRTIPARVVKTPFYRRASRG